MRAQSLRYFLLFVVLPAFAQAQAADPPTERASMTTVVVFLVLFFGGIVGYFVYLWWNQRKDSKGAEPPAR